MEIGVSVGGHVVVDGEIDALNVDASAEDVSRDTYAFVELLEFFVALDAIRSVSHWYSFSRCGLCLPFLLADTGMDCNGWEVALAEQLVELGGAKSTLDEDNDLIELELVEKVIKLAVLLAF